MSKIRIGPLSEVHFSDLKKILEPVILGPLQRIDDPDLLKSFYNQTNSHVGYYPTFSGLPEFIFIEVEKEHLLHIKAYLDRIGLPLVQGEAPQSVRDYLCPKCDYQGTAPGVCPKHDEPLLDFSTWHSIKQNKMNRLLSILAIFFLAAFAIGFLYMNFENFFRAKNSSCQSVSGRLLICPPATTEENK